MHTAKSFLTVSALVLPSVLAASLPTAGNEYGDQQPQWIAKFYDQEHCKGNIVHAGANVKTIACEDLTGKVLSVSWESYNGPKLQLFNNKCGQFDAFAEYTKSECINGLDAKNIQSYDVAIVPK